MSCFRNPKATLAGLLFSMLLLLPAGESAQTPSPYPTQFAQQPSGIQLPAGWTVFRGNSGLVVPHPVGWLVQERNAGAFLAYRPGPNGVAQAIVLVNPIERIEGRAMGVVEGVGQIFPDLFPQVKVLKARMISTMPEVAIGELQFAPQGRPFRGVALCFKQGQQGVLYAIGSAVNAWAQEEASMKQILNSFFYAGRDSAGTSVPPMVPWRDPSEGSFVCPVPQGWMVEGGGRRFSAVDFRPEVLVTSPDEKILVRLGDAWIPPMTLPTSLGQGLGMGEGSWYGAAGVNQMLILRYLPSTDFLLHFYLPQRVGAVSNVRVRDLPNISQQVLAEMRSVTMGFMEVRVDTGEVAFDFQSEKGPRKGYGFIQTELMGGGAAGPEFGTWRVRLFHGYLAEPSLEPVAQSVLTQMLAGLQFDPNWGMAQTRTAGKVSAIWNKSHNEIMGIINQTYQERNASQDRIWGKWAQVNRGQVSIMDPATGQKFDVPSGSNYYWRIGAGQEFVGTTTSDKPNHPNLYIQEMKILP